MKKLTREERRRRSQRRLQLITYLLFLLFLLAWLLPYMVMTVEAEPAAQYKSRNCKRQWQSPRRRYPGNFSLLSHRSGAGGRRERADRSRFAGPVSQVGRCHHHLYCCEERPHICGTGTGITASGRRVTPYVSCAVDPDIIPLGSTIMIEYNGEMVYLRADDTGPAVKGDHIDIAVKEHQEALSLGVKTADIWWCEE